MDYKQDFEMETKEKRGRFLKLPKTAQVWVASLMLAGLFTALILLSILLHMAGQVHLPAGAPARTTGPVDTANQSCDSSFPVYRVVQEFSYNPLTVPFITKIPMTMSPGKTIYIQGVPNAHPIDFGFNFLCGSPSEGQDIAFHFAARFNRQNSRKRLVLNTFKQGVWGEEELYFNNFPFMPNVQFDIMVLCEQSSFNVTINNQTILTFRYRIELERATHFNVKGDTRLTQISFEKNKFQLN